MSTKEYIIVEGDSFPIDTDEEVEVARGAMVSAELTSVPVWHGDPDCPDSYRSATRRFHVKR